MNDHKLPRTEPANLSSKSLLTSSRTNLFHPCLFLQETIRNSFRDCWKIGIHRDKIDGMIYLNGRLLTKSRALISVFDHGFLYGDGIYETLRVYRGVVFRIEEHIERLFRSASLIGLRIGKSPDEIRKAIYRTVRANRRKEASVRISVSRGPGPLGLDPSLCSKPTIVIVANPAREYPEIYYRKGVKVAIVGTRRNFRRAIDPRIKSLNFLNNILAKREAIGMGAYEAIMLNYRGYMTEGTISNIFFIKSNVLYTPAVEAGGRGSIYNQFDDGGDACLNS
jgi:branched-chain amino acid aminotransferase